MRGATYSIYDVRVTTNPEDVGKCRLVANVDSRDTARGCGLTVWPTPEECLRYQVRMAGGDTLLMNGPIGKAYECSTGGASPAEPSSATATPPASTPLATAPPEPHAPEPPASGAPAPPTPLPSAEPRPGGRVRITADSEAAKGCVYLGEVVSEIACVNEHGKASADCSDQAAKAGGDLILVQGARAQIFSCKARP